MHQPPHSPDPPPNPTLPHPTSPNRYPTPFPHLPRVYFLLHTSLFPPRLLELGVDERRARVVVRGGVAKDSHVVLRGWVRVRAEVCVR